MSKNDLSLLQRCTVDGSKVVLAGGVFDIIHPGHINTLNAARKLGDFLVVVIATDKTAIKMKKRNPLHSAQLRQELVSSLTMVDLCIIGDEEDIFKTVELIKPQIIALGYDQTHQEKFITDGCKKINLNVAVARLESPRPETFKFNNSKRIWRRYSWSLREII